ncbi:zinc finger protein 709-like [Brachionichthys hirsutus]|uniref:zinc finger protein 709-like n=1 Tax=Brachionichthys hirsutus TaxID=412623 RepID=UPI0036053700
MDEAAAAAGIKEDGAGTSLNDEDEESEVDVVSSAVLNHGVGVFRCQDCGEDFREESAYLEHRRQHLQEGECSEGRLEQLNHGDVDNEATNFCTLCSVLFVDANDFQSHMKSHSPNSQDKPQDDSNSGVTKRQTYECPECGKCYGLLGHFVNHQRSHRSASKSLCHDLEPLKKKPFQCESCGRNYSRASALDAHRRCHEEKLIKSRSRGSEDAGHTEESGVEAKPSEIQINSTENNFKCLCGKAFLTPMGLKTHRRFSGNTQCSPEGKVEKPKKPNLKFQCGECQKSFAGHVALINHQRWHVYKSNVPKPKFQCEQCGKVFMRLTFYYKHQRIVHSNETPAKSFEHQLCQLQKKAFECKDCGLKFSRASALHSHQLHHTDVFSETEKEPQSHAPLLPQPKILETETKRAEKKQVEGRTPPPFVISEDVNDTEEDLDSYEPGDFNVEVISASESEDESDRDTKPDLELLCESDRENEDAPSNAGFKPGMDLKIVQIDFEQPASIAREEENKATEERFDCPDCYRWFASASSLRVHRVWHGIHERRRRKQGQSNRFTCKECGLSFKGLGLFKTHLHQHALEEDEQMGSESGDGDDNSDVDVDGDADGCGASTLSGVTSLGSLDEKSHKGYQKRLLAHLRDHKTSRRFETTTAPRCDTCGKDCTTVRSLASHMELHKERPFWCLSCARGFANEGELDGHLQRHDSKIHKCSICHKSFSVSAHLADHYNTHAGAKPHQCTLCGKSFRLAVGLKLHKKKHAADHASNGMIVQDMNTEEPETDANLEELPAKEEHAEKRRLQKPCETAGREDQSNPDCGEQPARQFQSPTKKSGTGEPHVGRELGQSEPPEACTHGEHKHWDWECWECDMGFDQVEELHLHYVKHATGELPILQDDADGSDSAALS